MSLVHGNRNTETMFESTKKILQSFLVKTNLLIDLNIVTTILPAYIPGPKELSAYRSGTVIALKYKNVLVGQESLFKTKTGFKNACHLIVCYNTLGRVKRMVHVKITSSTFQVIGVDVADVEKIVYKVFLLLEKLNRKTRVFTPQKSSNAVCPNSLEFVEKNRLELLIVPVLNNYMITLDSEVVGNIFKYSRVQIVQKFFKNNFISFTVPNDPAITIKKSFMYKEYSNHPIPYIVWNKKYGRTLRYIEYDSYTTLLKENQKLNAQSDKYITMRLYSTGKVLISGFDEMLIQASVGHFLAACRQFN